MLDQQQASAEAAYWSGKPWPEDQRMSLVRLADWHDGFFETTIDELKETLGVKDE